MLLCSLMITLTLEVLPLWIVAAMGWMRQSMTQRLLVRLAKWTDMEAEGGRIKAKSSWVQRKRWRQVTWVEFEWPGRTVHHHQNSTGVPVVFCQVVAQSCRLIHSCIIHSESGARLWLCVFLCCSFLTLQREREFLDTCDYIWPHKQSRQASGLSLVRWNKKVSHNWLLWPHMSYMS